MKKKNVFLDYKNITIQFIAVLISILIIVLLQDPDKKYNIFFYQIVFNFSPVVLFFLILNVINIINYNKTINKNPNIKKFFNTIPLKEALLIIKKFDKILDIVNEINVNYDVYTIKHIHQMYKKKIPKYLILKIIAKHHENIKYFHTEEMLQQHYDDIDLLCNAFEGNKIIPSYFNELLLISTPKEIVLKIEKNTKEKEIKEILSTDDSPPYNKLLKAMVLSIKKGDAVSL